MTSPILITGANRGIGLAFVEHYACQGKQIIATCRQPKTADELQRLAQKHKSIRILTLDVTDQASIQQLTHTLADTALSILINNAGIYGPKDLSFNQLNVQAWQQVMTVNSIAPMMLTQALLPQLLKNKAAKVIFISSKMGSIADNSSGGSYIYRSSKSALNAAVRSLAIDYADNGLRVALLHPGWVQTEMGGQNALITTEESVSCMAQVITSLNQQNSGNFIAFDGKEIPW